MLLLMKLLIAVSEVSTGPYHHSGDRREQRGGKRERKGETRGERRSEGQLQSSSQKADTAPPLTTSLFHHYLFLCVYDSMQFP